MNDPKRWLQDENAPLELRELLAAGRRPPSLNVSFGAALAGVAERLGGHAPLAQTLGHAWNAKVATAVVGVGTAAMLGAAGWYLSSGAGPSAPAPAPLVSPLDLAPKATATPAPPTSAAATNAVTSSAPTFTAGSSPVPTTRGAASPVTDPAETIAREAALLERARRLLGSSPERALLLTKQHAARHPRGRLAAERELIAIDALVRLGRRTEAERRADPFLKSSSETLYARRVLELLGRSRPPGSGATTSPRQP